MSISILIVGVIIIYGGVALCTLFEDVSARKELNDYARRRYNKIKEDCKCPPDE